MTYRIRSIFPTVQGEGVQAGVPAVFVRFAGCNLWSGRDETRDRDAERNRAACPAWCDTDFAEGDPYSLEAVVEAVEGVARGVGMWPLPLVVLTGGEPLLQVDRTLVLALRALGDRRPRIAVETNGTRALHPALGEVVDWTTVSPKRRPAELALHSGSELKVPWPGALVEPEEYARALGPFRYYVVTPLATTTSVGVSVVDRDNIARAVRYVQENPRWRLSLQTHKHLGLP